MGKKIGKKKKAGLGLEEWGGGSFFPPLDFMIRGLTEEISYFEGEPQESLALPRFVCVFFSLFCLRSKRALFQGTDWAHFFIFHSFFPRKKTARHEERLKKSDWILVLFFSLISTFSLPKVFPSSSLQSTAIGYFYTFGKLQHNQYSRAASLLYIQISA